MKNMYILQPYEVGSKNAKSLAVIIPAKMVKECSISSSTGFVLRTNPVTKRLVIRQIAYPTEEEEPAEMIRPAKVRL